MIKQIKETEDINLTLTFNVHGEGETYLSVRTKLRALSSMLWNWILNKHISVEINIKASREIKEDNTERKERQLTLYSKDEIKQISEQISRELTWD